MSTPVGLSGKDAIALVRLYANENFGQPTDANVLTILNRAVAEVSRRCGGIRLYAPYYTVANQATVQLDSDILEVVRCNFSTGGSPMTQGAIVYDMFPLDEGMFMDAAAGFPAVGFGPPQAYFVYQDEGYAQTNALPVPAAPVLSTATGTSAGTEIEVVLTYTNPTGETTQSAVADITPTTAEQAVVASPQSYGNANGYHVYAGVVGGPYYLQDGGTATALGTTFTIPNPLVTSGTQPPGSNTATKVGQGGALTMQLYPTAMVGQVNVYYKGRPQLWSSTSSGTDYTNLDDSAQEAVVLYSVMRVLQARGRAAEAASVWKPDYEMLIENIIGSMRRRTIPRSGVVRDIAQRSFPNSPWWL